MEWLSGQTSYWDGREAHILTFYKPLQPVLKYADPESPLGLLSAAVLEMMQQMYPINCSSEFYSLPKAYILHFMFPWQVGVDTGCA